MTIATDAPLRVGQQVALRLVLSSRLEEAKPVASMLPRANEPNVDQAFSAFVRQGLPLIPEQLRRVSQWIQKHLTSLAPSEAETWSSSIGARAWPDAGPAEEALGAWTSWELSLSRGTPHPPPQEDFWDLWNAMGGRGEVHQVGVPFQWECERETHWALLKAEIPISSQRPLNWSVLTAAWGTGFRVGWESRGEANNVRVRLFDQRALRQFSKDWPAVQQELHTIWGSQFHFVLELDTTVAPGRQYQPGSLDEEA